MSKVKKTRDIPTTDRPVAYMNFINTLGEYRAGHTAMIGMGEHFLKGNDYFGSTKHIHFHRRLLNAIWVMHDSGLKKVIARDYKHIVLERIENDNLPKFIENCLRSLVFIAHRDFIKKCNESVGTGM